VAGDVGPSHGGLHKDTIESLMDLYAPAIPRDVRHALSERTYAESIYLKHISWNYATRCFRSYSKVFYHVSNIGIHEVDATTTSNFLRFTKIQAPITYQR
jgi:hypothetical protein